MINLKKHLRSSKTLVEIIIFLVGIILVIFGEIFQISIISGVGTSLLASAIIVFMTDVLIGADEDERLRTWGLEDVYKTRSEMNQSCDRYLLKTHNLCIIAFGLRSMLDTQQKALTQILKRGGSIRIITMVPDCNNLKERERDEKQVEGSISLNIKQLISWAKKQNAKGYTGKVEVRYHDHQPLNFMFLMDDRLYTGPYEYGKGSQQSISYEYNSTGAAYQYYKDYFNELWNNSDFCTNALNK